MSEAEQQADFQLPDLPDGWGWVDLGDLALARLGKTPRKQDYRNSGNHKIIKFRDVKEGGEIDWTKDEKGFVDSSIEVLRTLKELEEHDVLVTASAHMSEHIGKKVGLVKNIPGVYERAYVVGEVLQIRADKKVLPKWIMYFLQSSEGYNAIQRRVHGVHLIASRARKIEIPVAPIDQQETIVAEIEKQFSRLDEAVANLKRVKANLKRYKAAVLKAAVEGKLTEEWRKQNPDVEPASKFLERILAERRAKWEEAELAKMQAKGKVPKGDKWKENYRAPLSFRNEGPYEIPPSWSWARLDNVFDVITDGDHQAPPKSKVGIPFLVIGNVNRGRLNFDQTRFVSNKYFDSLGSTRTPRKGDLLYTVVGSYGIPAKVETNQPFCVQRHIAILKPSTEVNVDYLYHAMSSGLVFNQAAEASTGTAQKTVPLQALRSIVVPIPPVAEQSAVALAVDSTVSNIDYLDATEVESTVRTSRLRQSYLVAAFSGLIRVREY